MSDSSDDEWSTDWIPYSCRNDWADVTPIEQDDGEHPVVAIAYSNKFREVFDYFRAIMARKEKSPRALELTKDALRLNPANYTVWRYRRDILRELDCDLNEELEYIKGIIRTTSKNYQVWHHRRVIVELMNDASKELDLTEVVLQIDAKNYHAWQHRQWVIRAFNLFDDELNFVDRFIAMDIRNNSAWNQRYFVVQHYGFTTEVTERELHYAMNRIRVVKNNESAWNYLRGILRQIEESNQDQVTDVLDFCEELYGSGCRAAHLIAFLIDMYEEKCCQSADNQENQEKYSSKVYALCDDMATKYDVIRCRYWHYISDQLKHRLEIKQ